MRNKPAINQNSNKILKSKQLDSGILLNEIAKTDMSLRNKLYLIDEINKNYNQPISHVSSARVSSKYFMQIADLRRRVS